jgi:uncharacterized protein (DUF433 family)
MSKSPRKRKTDDIDWNQCPDVERTPGKCSGAWCVKGTRVMVECILDNAEDCSPEEIAGPDIYPELSVDVVRRILAFAVNAAPLRRNEP